MPDLSSSSIPRTGPPVSPEDLETFHYNRLATIASSSAWAHVDLLAFETIPRLDEAIAIRRALQRICSSHARKPAYASFVFPQGRRLPWPSRDDGPGAEEDMQQLLEEVVGDHGQGGPLPFDGVGINCTKPRYLRQLVERMTAALPAVRRKQSKPYLFVSGAGQGRRRDSDPC